MTDWKARCEELTDALACHYPGHVDDDELIKRARALLAQPEPERVGLSDEELLELYRGPGTFSPVEFARAAIAADRARCGRPAPTPAEGEVGELVAWLRLTAGSDNSYSRVRLTRAADLLEQYCLAPPTEASAAPTWPANFTRSMRAAQAWRLCIAANLPESSPIVNRITREAANGLSLKDVVDLIASESSEPGVSAPVSATQRHPTPVPVADRLPELRGMFERILCVARSSDQKPVGNIELADRLIKAVVSWGAALATVPVGEPAPPVEGEVEQ